MFIENLKLAFASIKSNRMRSFLTMLGIIIGIGSVIAIMTVGNSLKKSEEKSMSSMGANNIILSIYSDSEDVTVPSFSEENLNAIVKAYGNRIQAIGLDNVVGNGTSRSQVSSDNSTTTVQVDGINSGYFKTNGIKLEKGSNFTTDAYDNGSNVAIVSDKYANAIFGSVDAAMGQDVDVAIENEYTTYTIVGVYKFQNNDNFGTAKATMFYVPLKKSYSIMHSSDNYGFTVMAKSSDDASSLASDIQTLLQNQMKLDEDVVLDVESMQSYIQESSKMLSQITLAISMIAGIALLVGGIGVMNIMTVSITERTKEIGTRKALGAENHQILMQFVTEAVILCLMGGIIGVTLGITLGLLASHVMGYGGSVSIMSILGSVGFSMGVGLFFGYAPARKAARMNPIDALRYE